MEAITSHATNTKCIPASSTAGISMEMEFSKPKTLSIGECSKTENLKDLVGTRISKPN